MNILKKTNNSINTDSINTDSESKNNVLDKIDKIGKEKFKSGSI